MCELTYCNACGRLQRWPVVADASTGAAPHTPGWRERRQPACDIAGVLMDDDG